MCDLCNHCYEMQFEPPRDAAMLDFGGLPRATKERLVWGETEAIPTIVVPATGAIYPIMMADYTTVLFVDREITDALAAISATGWKASPCRFIGGRRGLNHCALGITGRCRGIQVRAASLPNERTKDPWGPSYVGLHVRTVGVSTLISLPPRRLGPRYRSTDASAKYVSGRPRSPAERAASGSLTCGD